MWARESAHTEHRRHRQRGRRGHAALRGERELEHGQGLHRTGRVEQRPPGRDGRRPDLGRGAARVHAPQYQIRVAFLADSRVWISPSTWSYTDKCLVLYIQEYVDSTYVIAC